MKTVLGPIVRIETDRCLSWSIDVAPCKLACPLGIDVQEYVSAIAHGNFSAAFDIIMRECPLPSVCARICYAPCEGKCKRGEVDEPIAILDLKRAVVDYEHNIFEMPAPRRKLDGEKIAIVGSGPAGLSCAYYLSKLGYKVTIFEAFPFVGGMLYSGIPEYRLPKEVLRREIDRIVRLGIEIRTNTPINRELTIDDLFRRRYKAVFLATGAHRSKTVGIPGEASRDVFYGIDFLRELNLGREVRLGRKVAIIGGGNAAVDAARCAVRLGSNVSILYRRSIEEMPATDTEIEAAESEGVKIECLVAPSAIHAINGRVTAVRCARMQLGAHDASGRRQPVPIPNSEFNIDADAVIVAIGQTTDLSFLTKATGIEIDKNRNIIVDPSTLATTRDGVFAGGDVQTGPKTAIEAMAAGKKAAASISRYLKSENLKEEAAVHVMRRSRMLPEVIIPRERQRAPVLPPRLRVHSFEEVNLGFTSDQAIQEAKRCLGCSVCNRCLEVIDCSAILPCENNDRLSPRVDENRCIGCQVCAQVCPYNSILRAL